jgi:hypothetical protein
MSNKVRATYAAGNFLSGKRERKREIGLVRLGQDRFVLHVCRTRNPRQCHAQQLVLNNKEKNS